MESRFVIFMYSWKLSFDSCDKSIFI